MDLCTEGYAEQNIAEKKIPVFSCEGPCIRAVIAKRAADLVTQQLQPYARACHVETLGEPHSAMARWIRAADKVVIVDGCFLKCNGEKLRSLAGEDKLLHIDAFGERHSGRFLMDDVSEDERNEIARQAADKIIAKLKHEGNRSGASDISRGMAKELRCWWPNCNTLLREDVSASRSSEPPLEQDHTGYYVRCPQCGARSYPPQALCESIGTEALA